MKPWPHKKPLIQRWKNILPLSEYPKLTIVTPSFNQGRFLEETILSVLNQDYPNLEYIIIDGGSTDNSVDIIRKYEDRLAYWVSEKDRGQSHALNKGLEISTGEIIGWINSDDIYMPWTFRTAVKTLITRPELSLIWGSRILINEDTNVVGFSMASEYIPETMHFCINSETAFWTRDTLESVGLADESYQFAMDLEYFGRIAKSRKVGPIPSFQGCFRCYPQNKSSTMQDVCDSDSSKAYKDLYGLKQPSSKEQPKKFSMARICLIPLKGVLPYLKYRYSCKK